MTNTWTVNADGSVTFSGTVNFPAGTNLASGAGIAIFGPNGGTTNFPAIATGDPGLPPIINWTVSQVAYGTALPSPNPAVTQLSPGGPGVASQYNATIYVNAGQPGASGSTILGATDLTGTPAAQYMIGYDSIGAKPQWQPKLVGGFYFTNSISATASNTVSVKPMASIAVPAMPFAWWPEVRAQANVVGAVDTRVDLVARLSSTSGTICGYGYGAAGASPPPVEAGSYGLATGSGNIVAAASAATIFLNAENQTSSANPWNTTSTAFFQVKVCPVPS